MVAEYLKNPFSVHFVPVYYLSVVWNSMLYETYSVKIRQIETKIIPGYVYMCQNDLHELEQFEKKYTAMSCTFLEDVNRKSQAKFWDFIDSWLFCEKAWII